MVAARFTFTYFVETHVGHSDQIKQRSRFDEEFSRRGLHSSFTLARNFEFAETDDQMWHLVLLNLGAVLSTVAILMLLFTSPACAFLVFQPASFSCSKLVLIHMFTMWC